MKKKAKKTGPKPGKKRQPNDLIWYIEKMYDSKPNLNPKTSQSHAMRII